MEKKKYIVVFEPYGDAARFYGPFSSKNKAREFITQAVESLSSHLGDVTVEKETFLNPHSTIVTDNSTSEPYVFYMQKLYTKFEPGKDF